jgi:hypothetical protein
MIYPKYTKICIYCLELCCPISAKIIQNKPKSAYPALDYTAQSVER